MLIEFSVENFKCFAEKQTLDMRPDDDITSLDENLIRTGLMYKDEDEQGKEKELLLLPSVAIYGANASGKSSLLEILRKATLVSALTTELFQNTFFLNTQPVKCSTQEVVLFIDKEDLPKEENGFTHNYKPAISNCSSTVSYLGSVNNLNNNSNLEGPRECIFRDWSLSEKLHSKESNFRDLPIFGNSESYNMSTSSPSGITAYRIFYFLDDILKRAYDNISKDGYFDVTSKNIFLVDTIQRNKQKVISLLQKADFNIDDIELIQLPSRRIQYALQFKFKGQDQPLYFNDQSEGTKQFLLIMPTIVHVLETGAILLADELEAHLHPDLCRAIIELFNNPETNPKGSQLIFTTHNQDFMASSLMRPDQIYFVNKDQSTGASEVYRASDFKEFDWNNYEVKVREFYEEGLLGANPNVNRLAGEA